MFHFGEVVKTTGPSVLDDLTTSRHVLPRNGTCCICFTIPHKYFHYHGKIVNKSQNTPVNVPAGMVNKLNILLT